MATWCHRTLQHTNLTGTTLHYSISSQFLSGCTAVTVLATWHHHTVHQLNAVLQHPLPSFLTAVLLSLSGYLVPPHSDASLLSNMSFCRTLLAASSSCTTVRRGYLAPPHSTVHQLNKLHIVLQHFLQFSSGCTVASSRCPLLWPPGATTHYATLTSDTLDYSILFTVSNRYANLTE